MRKIVVENECVIRRPLEEVRAQFADYIYHSQYDVHPGITFTVTGRSGNRTRYSVAVRLLGMMQRDDVVTTAVGEATVESETIAGTNKGARIHHEFSDRPDGATLVRSRLSFPARGIKALLAPAFKAAAQKIVDRAIEEDRRDLESGRYQRYLAAQSGKAA
jgi:hypothetical protein